MLWNNVSYIFLERCHIKDYENVKMANLPFWWAAQLPIVYGMISKNTDLGDRENVKLLFFLQNEFYTHDHKNHHIT